MHFIWLARTDPADVARVESKTFMSSRNEVTIRPLADKTHDRMTNWWSLDRYNSWAKSPVDSPFVDCMKGRIMYVLPFSLGPIGGPFSKLGVELTDSPYVAASMRIMTRMGSDALETMNGQEFVRCIHSVGRPLPMDTSPIQNWPCNPQMTNIGHCAERNEIASFGSGYGGNSLLGKKCLALRLGSYFGKQQGWLAEHMLIIGITTPSGEKKYIAAAFPSACGKTNLAMMKPSLPGYKIECVGDDIAWMRFDSEGNLRAINPEAGFFGVAPGTCRATNPQAMKAIESDTLFTNVAETADGHVYWEGLEKETDPESDVTDWMGRKWTQETPAAHPNSRFCTPVTNLECLDRDAWNGSEGVHIEAILFGGRRLEGVPLVCEAFNWEHGVYYGASMRSESTAAAEHRGKVIMHDPFAMRPFFGYNFRHYLQHWLDLPKNNPKAAVNMPKIFKVNWFGKNDDGSFLWPGFGENCRVLDWIVRRLTDQSNDGGTVAEVTPIGYVPKRDAFRLDGLPDQVVDNWHRLFAVSDDFWRRETVEVTDYLNGQTGGNLPKELKRQGELQLERLAMK